jgi:hypothetical protein
MIAAFPTIDRSSCTEKTRPPAQMGLAGGPATWG